VSQKGEQYPLGFEMYSGQTFANADFLKNCVEYLIDEQGLLTARNKEIKLRMLDKKRTEDPKEALKWQLLNIIVPILSIFIFGIIYHYIRKRKWTS
jgi:ABC-2 type transport system permease protein